MKNTFDGRAVIRFDIVNQHLNASLPTINFCVLMTDHYGFEHSVYKISERLRILPTVMRQFLKLK